MFIKRIFNIDNDAHEADIIVSDGNLDILCYAFDFQNANIDRFELSPMDYNEVYISYEKGYKIKKFDQSKYNYFIQCRIIDIKNGIVELYGTNISLGRYLPGDLKNGDWITVKCYRLGIYLFYS